MPGVIPLSLALFDFPPNFFFLLGAFWLWKKCYRSNWFAAGGVLVFLNGISKAVWKLIRALSGQDIVWLSQIFIVLLTAGFLSLLIASLRLQQEQKSAPFQASHQALPAVLLAAAVWKIPFFTLTGICAMGAYGLWIARAVRQHMWTAAVFLGLGLAAMLAMTGMSGGEQNLARSWTAETINNVGEICFAVGAYFLKRD